MKLNILNCKLEKAIALKGSMNARRYSTDLIKYNKAESKLIATDGRILAAIHVENDGDNGDDKFITTDNFKAARKKENLHNGAVEFNIDGDTCNMASGAILPNPSAGNDGEFPKYEMLFTKETPEVVVHFNPKLLVNLIEALGAINTQDKTPTITLKVFGDSKPMHIEYKENKGVIMPCTKPYRKD